MRWALSTLLILLSLSSWASGYSWKACESKAWGGSTFPFTPELNVRAECLPDTLYSWSNLDRIQRTLGERAPGQLYPVNRNLYLWRTPLMSYGYGETVLRFKLRPQVKFRPLIMTPGNNSERFCTHLSKYYGKEIHNTVYVAWLKWNPGYHEYILCSDGPVASVSFGTPEILQEVLREKNWIEQSLPGDYDLLHRAMGVTWRKRETNFAFDGGEWSHEALRAKIKLLEDLSANQAGGVFGRPGESVADHYLTGLPSYFNP